ncbi:hypothetical protein NT05LM_3149, partial [Listeria marthii FSL S4-120]
MLKLNKSVGLCINVNKSTLVKRPILGNLLKITFIISPLKRNSSVIGAIITNIIKIVITVEFS